VLMPEFVSQMKSRDVSVKHMDAHIK